MEWTYYNETKITYLGHTLEIFDTGRDILLIIFLGQIQHVGGEQGLTIGLLVTGIRISKPAKNISVFLFTDNYLCPCDI